jgi:microcystin-dependent protein
MDIFIGYIVLFPYTFTPMDWLLCNGQSLPVSQYSTLYALIGNTYGGDSYNFNLPNMLGLEPVPYMKYYICLNGDYPTRP